eukprot:COSAG01_NODE_5610_length_4147_cov_332.779150_5_plen_96_part_00
MQHVLRYWVLSRCRSLLFGHLSRHLIRLEQVLIACLATHIDKHLDSFIGVHQSTITTTRNDRLGLCRSLIIQEPTRPRQTWCLFRPGVRGRRRPR